MACGGVKEAKVGEAFLAQADGTEPAPDGPTVVVLPGRADPLPEGEVVRLAIDRDVLYGEIAPLIAQVRARGGSPALLVGDRRQRLAAIAIDGWAPGETSIRVVATADGKACVSLPGIDEAKCVRTTQARVDRSYVRELVREAFKASSLRRVTVEAEAGLRWGDVVRAVDGARTCCAGERIAVALKSY